MADKNQFADSVRSTFKATTPRKETRPASKAKSKAEEPVASGDSQVTLYMPPELLLKVDELLLRLRGNFTKGNIMRRAGLVRALLGALVDANLDLSDARSEEDVRAIVAERLGKR